MLRIAFIVVAAIALPALQAQAQMPSRFTSSDQSTGQCLNAGDRSPVVLTHGGTATTHGGCRGGLPLLRRRAFGHCTAFHAAHGQVVMFRGTDGHSLRGDKTWIWDGVNWLQRNSAISPTFR